MKKILRKPAVLGTTGLTNSTLYDLIARGKFPRPIKITERSTGWIEDEVQEWVGKRIAESRQDAA